MSTGSLDILSSSTSSSSSWSLFPCEVAHNLSLGLSLSLYSSLSCICVPYSFLNSYYHKLSENVWVWGSRGSRSGDLVGCHHSGTDGRTNEQKGKIELLSQWTMDGWDEQLLLKNFAYCSQASWKKLYHPGWKTKQLFSPLHQECCCPRSF